MVCLSEQSAVSFSSSDEETVHVFYLENCERTVTWPPPWLSEEEHVDQQLQQVGLSDDRPEKEFRDEAGCDALQHGGCEEDSSEALLVPRVEDLDHLAEGMLSFLLQAFNKQSCL